MWALPGGFVDLVKDRDLADTAKRKLKIKTGVSAPYLEQVATFSGAQRDPRGWSVTVAYYALLDWDEINTGLSDDFAKWVPVDEVQTSHCLAFDHNEILAVCTDRLSNKTLYTSIAINLMPNEFTLTELQRVFEIILGHTLEKKSFRRRILDADLLAETGNLKTGSNRPAKLYSAKKGGHDYTFPRVIEGARQPSGQER